jgi:hypothetical protein
MVPLLPLRSSYRTNCASCGNSTIVSEEQADRLLASGPHVGKVPLPEAVAA